MIIQMIWNISAALNTCIIKCDTYTIFRRPITDIIKYCEIILLQGFKFYTLNQGVCYIILFANIFTKNKITSINYSMFFSTDSLMHSLNYLEMHIHYI